jgi:hypothetical protein
MDTASAAQTSRLPQEALMREPRFDTLARTTAKAISRRSSFVAFGGAALATAMPGAPVADAARDTGAKKTRKKLKKVKRQFKRACAAQPGQCQEAMNALCATTMNPAECLQIVSPCCARIINCDVGPAFTCLLSL